MVCFRKLARAAVTGAVVLGALAARPASAINVNLTSVVPEGSFFRFTYTLITASTEQFVLGDVFSVVDFRGYVPGSISAPGLGVQWLALTDGTGPIIPGVTIPDSAAITNLVFPKIGNPTPAAGFTLTNFSALSRFSGTQLGFFGANATDSGEPGGRLGVRGNVLVPSEVIPEPGTLGLLGLGLGGVVGGVIRRKRHA